MPEVGDLDKPKLVFFFDEAHLLFDDAPKALLTAIEQVVRLIRSKGVGVYFVTQNPLDVPDTVLGQLGNRVQHALRAFTPRDQKAVRAAAETFRKNPAFDTADAIMHLGVGEALVSMLGDKGAPEMVDRVLIAPPSARVGPITPQERAADRWRASKFGGKYDTGGRPRVGLRDPRGPRRGRARGRRRRAAAGWGRCRRRAGDAVRLEARQAPVAGRNRACARPCRAPPARPGRRSPSRFCAECSAEIK